MPESRGLIGPNSRNAWRADGRSVTLARPHRDPRPVTVEALPQTVVADLAATALIVVDMQNDFCSPDGWLASIGVDVTPARAPIPVIARLLPPLRAAACPGCLAQLGQPPRPGQPPARRPARLRPGRHRRRHRRPTARRGGPGAGAREPLGRARRRTGDGGR